MANPEIGLIEAPNFGEFYCPQGPNVWQNFANDFASQSRIVATSGAQATQYFVFGSAKPTVDQQQYPWLRYDPLLKTFRWYAFDIFGEGIWASPNTIAPNDAGWRIFDGVAADVNTYDEGAAGTVTNTTGPFWEIVADMTGRSPIGVGLIPASTPATTLTVGDTAGEANHTLLDTELPAVMNLTAPNLTAFNTNLGVGDQGQWLAIPATSGVAVSNPAFQDGVLGLTKTGGGQPFNVVHPVRAVYFIRRTARIYYTVP